MLRVLFFFLLFSSSMDLFSQADTTNDHSATYDNYYDQLKTQFKKESWWYRRFNQYEINPGFSKYSIGPSMTAPLIGWDNVHDNFGIRYRQTHFEMGLAFWKGQLNNELDTNSFNKISLGYFTPLNTFKVGKRYLDVKGFLLQPTASLGYTYTNKNHGLYTSLGLHLQLPFVVLGARANVEYTLDGGVNVFPELSIQLDALRTLLDPNKVKTGKFNSSSSSATPLGGGWYSVTTTYSSTDFEIQDIGPFWGITPRVGRAFAAPEPYNTMGLGITGRIGFLGADIHVDKGALVPGVNTSVTDLDPVLKSEFDNEFIEGKLSTTEITFEGNINIVGLFLAIFKPAAVRDMGFKTTPLNRLNFHLGVTQIKPGEVNYFGDSAQIYTDNFFASNPDIERNSINDPLIHEKEWAVTYGVSYEMGAIGIRVNNKLSHTMGTSRAVELYYVLPIGKIIKAYKKDE